MRPGEKLHGGNADLDEALLIAAAGIAHDGLDGPPGHVARSVDDVNPLVRGARSEHEDLAAEKAPDGIEVDHADRLRCRPGRRGGDVALRAGKSRLFSRERDEDDGPRCRAAGRHLPGQLEKDGNAARVVVGAGMHDSVPPCAEVVVVRAHDDARCGPLGLRAAQDAGDVVFLGIGGQHLEPRLHDTGGREKSVLNEPLDQLGTDPGETRQSFAALRELLLGEAPLLLDLTLAPDVHVQAGQLRREARVLPPLADGQRELVVGHDDEHRARLAALVGWPQRHRRDLGG